METGGHQIEEDVAGKVCKAYVETGVGGRPREAGLRRNGRTWFQNLEALVSPFEEKYTSETGFQKMLLRVLFLRRGKIIK